jgi:signal transduction histidine kinase
MARPAGVIHNDAPSDALVTTVRTVGAAHGPAGSVAAARVAVVVALGLAGLLWPHPSDAQKAVFLVWGLFWLPWSILLLFAGTGSRSSLLRRSGVFVDVAVLTASLAVCPGVPGVFMVLILAAVMGGWLTWAGLPRAGSVAVVIIAAGLVRSATISADKAAASSAAFAVIACITCAIWMRMERISNRAEVLTSSLRSRAETVLARVPHPLVVSGVDGRIVSCNPATIEVMGAFDLDRPCCEALGLHYGERALDCSDGCALLELCREAEDGYVEVWRLRADGTRQPLLASAAEMPDSRGHVVEVVHSMRDITRLKEADEAKTIFLATASHELKTPLTVINGYAQLLLRDDSDSLRQQGLEAIAGRAKELAEIVERLLLSSRIESGRLSVTLAPMDLGALVQERVGALATATNHEINVSVSSGLPAVEGDVPAMATVLDHLLDNAIKYSAPDQPIDVFVRGGPHWVTVSVTDRGEGMGEEQRRRCFDKFWQAESGDNRRHGGTGLGLYIVKSLVDSMAGRITVESKPGEGTTFHVTLPTPDGHLPSPRTRIDAEPAIVTDLVRQVGVPDNATP